jgi:RimJ/RimL family protein N-acetyltransferase
MKSTPKSHLVNIAKEHWCIYKDLYQNPKVMHFIRPPLNDEDVLKSFELLLERDKASAERMTLIIVYNFSDAGLIQTKLEGDSWFLGVMLLPEFQGLGLAQFAHEKMIQSIKKLSAYNADKQVFVAECQKNNQAANQLYSKLGFSLTEIKSAQSKTNNRWER